jgi:hypothetical protein
VVLVSCCAFSTLGDILSPFLFGCLIGSIVVSVIRIRIGSCRTVAAVAVAIADAVADADAVAIADAVTDAVAIAVADAAVAIADAFAVADAAVAIADADAVHVLNGGCCCRCRFSCYCGR